MVERSRASFLIDNLVMLKVEVLNPDFSVYFCDLYCNFKWKSLAKNESHNLDFRRVIFVAKRSSARWLDNENRGDRGN